jgi:DHA2 family multidrug resistance protein
MTDIQITGADMTGARASGMVWVGFALMCIALFMSVLDVQIVLTALPTIQQALHINADAMSWIQTSYLTAEVISVPLSGLLTRALGLRWSLVMAVAGFTVASLACGMSDGFAMLIVSRTVQGLFGGVIIPCVFSAVFILFGPRDEPVATGLAGISAMIAPTLGPWLGGWLTVHLGWPSLFFINLAPGIVAVLGMAWLIPCGARAPALLRNIDRIGLVMLALAMIGIEVGLKEAPQVGWTGLDTLLPGLGGAVLLGALVARNLRTTFPLVDTTVLGDWRVALGTGCNAVLGATLYGSTYLMVVFLGLVRGLDALAIGQTVILTGAAQLVTAPIAVWAEKRVAPLLFCLTGFALFGLGCWTDTGLTPDSGWQALFWPQMLRGAALMVCILATTRLALGHLQTDMVANASGLFNLARNLGGALGIALIDSLLYGETPGRVAAISLALRNGDVSVAAALHLPIDDFLAMHGQPIDADTRALLEPLITHLALCRSVNATWLVLALACIAPVVACAIALFRNGLPGLRGGVNTDAQKGSSHFH